MAQAQSTIQTPSDLAVNIKSFGRHLRASNHSPRTVKSYLEACQQFAAFILAKRMPATVAGVRREHVEAFIQDQLDRLSPASAAVRHRSLVQFWKWLVDEGEIKESPMARMRPPKVEEKLTPILTLQEIKRLFDACSGKDFEARRDLALIRVFISTMARRAEVAGLRTSDDPAVNDIDLDTGQARIHGKGARQRLVPLDTKTTMALDRYIRARMAHPEAASEWLWLGRKGRLTEDGIRQAIERRAAIAGIENLHPHMFRHSAAHFWLASGGGELDLQRIAGWRDPQMLRRYGASLGQERALQAAKTVGLGNLV